jgi:Zn-dependent protease
VISVEPPHTRFDLHFQLLGFPVRIHPFFWLVGFLLGVGGEARGIALVIWMVALLVSILLHELGHALMIRRFGRPAYIVLHGLGGLAIEGYPGGAWGGSWEAAGASRRSPGQQIAISAAGPGAQLLLAAVLVATIYLMNGTVEVVRVQGLPLLLPHLGGELAANQNLHGLLFDLLQVNTLWPLVNLLPVLPLDGGQIALQLWVQYDPWGGVLRALWLSVVTGGAVAVAALLGGHLLIAILFASLAISSYGALQQMSGRRPW